MIFENLDRLKSNRNSQKTSLYTDAHFTDQKSMNVKFYLLCDCLCLSFFPRFCSSTLTKLLSLKCRRVILCKILFAQLQHLLSMIVIEYVWLWFPLIGYSYLISLKRYCTYIVPKEGVHILKTHCSGKVHYWRRKVCIYWGSRLSNPCTVQSFLWS